MTSKEIRDCSECGTPLLTLEGFDGVVVNHECVQCDWQTPLRELVNDVLATLWERRPYKHDLARFRDREPGGYEEMLQVMEWYAARAIRKHGTILVAEAGASETVEDKP